MQVYFPPFAGNLGHLRLEVVQQALEGFGGAGEFAQFGLKLGGGVLFHT
jgi:hypothetical protein